MPRPQRRPPLRLSPSPTHSFRDKNPPCLNPSTTSSPSTIRTIPLTTPIPSPLPGTATLKSNLSKNNPSSPAPGKPSAASTNSRTKATSSPPTSPANPSSSSAAMTILSAPSSTSVDTTPQPSSPKPTAAPNNFAAPIT